MTAQINANTTSLNDTGFSQLFDQYHRYLFAFALKLSKRKEDAEDLVQETAMRAYRNKAKYQVGTNFKAWAATIMRNTFINGYRKKKRRNMYQEPIDKHAYSLEIDPSYNKGIDDLQYEDLQSVLNEIGENYSIPFRMFYKGYQYDEIAESMNIPIGTVKSRIFFARRKMRELIEELYAVNDAALAES
jgi:RNA polymerase sigma-70 factor (ECF subfamily)